MPSMRTLANWLYRMILPGRDREWLRALAAELPAVPGRGRSVWLAGAAHVLIYATGRRLFADAALWWAGLAAGLLVAYLGLSLGSLLPHLIVLTLAVAALALLAPDWAWRWALLVSLPKPLLVEAGWYGPYFYNRFDAYYAVFPAVVIALTVAWSRGFVARRLA